MCARRALWIFLLAGCIAAAAEAPDIPEDAPVASRPARGDATGRITPPGKVARLDAVCRATGKAYSPARLDAETGRFAFQGLPGDAAYDLRVVTTEGAHVEGIDLSWHAARMLRLAAMRRKQLALPAEPEHEFTRDDAAELIGYVRDLKDFAEVRRVLYLNGLGRRATMLVEATRTRPFHAQRGDEVIWRIELWYFKYQYGGWERVGHVERVLERHRIPAGTWRRITKVYYPQLSAYVNENGASEPVEFRVPERLDPARGRIAGTEPVQTTQPIILGVKADHPETRPADR